MYTTSSAFHSDMPKSLRSFVVSSKNAILRRKPIASPLHDANSSLSDNDKNPSITPGRPPPSTRYGLASNGELSPTCHPKLEANEPTPHVTRLKESQGTDNNLVCDVIIFLSYVRYSRRRSVMTSMFKLRRTLWNAYGYLTTYDESQVLHLLHK
jgi:hypothetical protein